VRLEGLGRTGIAVRTAAQLTSRQGLAHHATPLSSLATYRRRWLLLLLVLALLSVVVRAAVLLFP
jgi:hypothetical protein